MITFSFDYFYLIGSKAIGPIVFTFQTICAAHAQMYVMRRLCEYSMILLYKCILPDENSRVIYSISISRKATDN